jgi:hypothetical protein
LVGVLLGLREKHQTGNKPILLHWRLTQIKRTDALKFRG